MILEMNRAGFSPERISKSLGINIKTVQSYLPRIRPVYGEDLSENAKRIRKCRKKITPEP